MSNQRYSVMRNILLLLMVSIVIFTFSACDNPTDDTTQSDTPKTQVEFNNLEQYSVTVYSDPARLNVITQVDKLSTVTIPTAPAPLGTAFYPTFNLDLFDVPGLSIPYNAPPIIAMIEDKKTAKVPIPKLESIEINSAYIKIKNDSDFSLSLRQGNTEILTLDSRNIIVMPGQNAIYEVTPGPVSSYTFMRNTTTAVEFPAGLSEFKSGIIYSFTYANTGLVLTSQTSVLQSIPPSMPLNVQAEVLSKDSVRITWNEVYGATSYRVYRATSAEGAYSSVGTPVAASYTDVSLSAGQAYYYKITALSGGNRESAKSTAVVAIMPPANVRVTAASANSISLAWNAFSGASGYNIYRSEREDGIYSKVNTAAVTGAEFTDTGLSQDAAYWYKVSAIVDGAEGLLSDQIPASTSSVPGNVRITSSDTTRVVLAWNVVSEAGGYNVYRSDSEDGIYNRINTGAVTGTEFTDTGLSPDATYWYKISAIISDNEGLQSIQISASTLTSVPGNVRVTSSDTTRVVLAWNIVSEAGGYNVYRSDSEDGIYNRINTGALTGTAFTDTGLSPDTTYWYKISAIIDGAEGLLSSQIPASTSSIPGPGNVRVTAETVNSVSLAWNIVSEAGGYNVYRSDSENGIYNRINTGAVTGTAFTDTNVSAYTTYFYKVSAMINSIEGIQSNPVSAITVNMVPGSGLAEKLSWLQTNALSNVDYIIEVTAAESIGPTTLSYSNRTNIGITLRGTGAVRTVSLSSNGAMFTVASGVTLVLDNNITLQGRSGNNNSLVWVNEGGTLVMNTGSRITGNTFSDGGGVFVGNGTFTMNGGTISSNTASYGGGVIVCGTGTFTMNGGTISNNTASGSGGGVSVHDPGTFTMNGGTISSNTASGSGGGVGVGGTFTMSGGTISSNTAASSFGGGVFVYGTFTMNSGTISSNTASGGGGGVYVSDGIFTMRGGTISGNTASGLLSDGGGVYVDNNGTFTMSSGTISGNTASGILSYGGGVYVDNNGTFSKTGGTIYGYSASDTANSNVVKNSSGVVQSNRGHAVYVDSSPVKRRETTAGTSVNLSFNGSNGTFSGGWDY